MRKALLCVGLALTLAGCAALPTPVVRPTGRPEPSVTETAKPRASRTPRPSATHEPTETPPASPSASLTPTLPLTPTVLLPLSSSTPTAMVLVGSPTPTPAPPSALDCKLIWQSPPSVATYLPGEKFSVGWNIRNVGTTTWEPGSFEFTYLAGAKLATHDFLIPLTTSVAPGDEVVLSVPMKAPQRRSIYTTHWGIRQADAYFCRLTLTILVQ